MMHLTFGAAEALSEDDLIQSVEGPPQVLTAGYGLEALESRNTAGDPIPKTSVFLGPVEVEYQSDLPRYLGHDWPSTWRA